MALKETAGGHLLDGLSIYLGHSLMMANSTEEANCHRLYLTGVRMVMMISKTTSIL